MRYTRHAHARTQQRGIPGELVDLIMNEGSYQRERQGIFRVKISNRDYMQCVQRFKANNQIQLLEKAKNRTLIVDFYSNSLITAY